MEKFNRLGLEGVKSNAFRYRSNMYLSNNCMSCKIYTHLLLFVDGQRETNRGINKRYSLSQIAVIKLCISDNHPLRILGGIAEYR